jgi:type VI secretion system protein ImpL
VDASGPTWRWRSGDAGTIGLPTSLLRQFQAAAGVRKAFFESGGQMPKIRFSVAPEYLDEGSTRFILDVDGQVLDYRHGPQRMVAMNWPSMDYGRMSATFESGGVNSVAVQTEGPWALFRGLDQARLEGGGTRFVATFQSGGRSARVRLEASSVHNPFGRQLLQDFRCLEAL